MDMDGHRRHGMKQKLIYWLLNNPCPVYTSMKVRMWMKQKPLLWDRIRFRLANRLMGED